MSSPNTAFAAFDVAVRELQPKLVVVLGSGLGSVPHRFEELASLAFADIPEMPTTSVHGHKGTIALGRCGSQPVLLFRGRLHLYEGHGWRAVVKTLELAAEWGTTTLLLTNAAGGIRDDLNPGDLMLLNAHFILQRRVTPTQHADRVLCYSPELNGIIREIEREAGRHLASGTYAAVTGPCYETPAEIRALRTMGADAVGMSTAYEAEFGDAFMQVAAISCITNKAAGLAAGTLDHAEVLANAHKPAERLSSLIEAFAARC